VRWQKMALLVLRRVGLCVGQKPNVPFVRLAKIVFKKMCGGEKNKTRSVGLSCRKKVRC